jgi:hypothetical protein
MNLNDFDTIFSVQILSNDILPENSKVLSASGKIII